MCVVLWSTAQLYLPMSSHVCSDSALRPAQSNVICKMMGLYLSDRPPDDLDYPVVSNAATITTRTLSIATRRAYPQGITSCSPICIWHQTQTTCRHIKTQLSYCSSSCEHIHFMLLHCIIWEANLLFLLSLWPNWQPIEETSSLLHRDIFWHLPKEVLAASQRKITGTKSGN